MQSIATIHAILVIFGTFKTLQITDKYFTEFLANKYISVLC